ncbi:hypothetical protein [Paraliomyxa miuraensis]|nr:hypothetical protein [Paraliomyxa miuraensis]MCX4241202.1 hypothetical protein [Paraliomyxa miuraensis]
MAGPRCTHGANRPEAEISGVEAMGGAAAYDTGVAPMSRTP